jgi:hypothetical protein
MRIRYLRTWWMKEDVAQKSTSSHSSRSLFLHVYLAHKRGINLTIWVSIGELSAHGLSSVYIYTEVTTAHCPMTNYTIQCTVIPFQAPYNILPNSSWNIVLTTSSLELSLIVILQSNGKGPPMTSVVHFSGSGHTVSPFELM